MKVRDAYNYYKATFRGEIIEKFKRKLLAKLNLLKIELHIPSKLDINYFLLSEKDENNKEIKTIETIEKIKIFNEVIELDKIEWTSKNNDKKVLWYKENIKKYGDVKYTWEINRLQFLLPLALNGEEENAIVLLEKWIEDNPFEFGINWSSNLEVAIRSVSILNLLTYSNKKKYWEKYKNILYFHGKHLFGDIKYTEKCIPNNHLIGEAAALYCLSKVLNTDESFKWENKAKNILENHIFHIQNDGTYIEASLSYHKFVLQMYIIVIIYSKVFKNNFLVDEILEKIEKSYIFLKSVEKPDKSYTDFGDNDDGYFYKAKLKNKFYEFVDSLETLLGVGVIKGEIQILEDIYKVSLNENKIMDYKEKNFFENGKYYIYKNEDNYLFFNNQKQVYHSHSDGLSIEMSINGVNLLSDSGTYLYNGNKEKRNYYRGTKAHNTVWLGEDQSKQVGSFRWINSAKNLLEVVYNDKIKIIEGKIETLSGKEHKRQVSFDENFKNIKVIDKIKNTKKIELNWHFSKNVNIVQIENNIILIKKMDYLLEIKCDFKYEIKILKSKISKEYGVEEERINLKIANKEEKNYYNIISIFRKNKVKG